MGQETSHEQLDDSVPSRTLKSRNIESVAELIKDGRADRIVVLTGAGLSTAAGIPDFRSPDTGLYANLARLNLPYAEAVFDISYFRNNPLPFYALAKELYPGKYKPTLAHCFIALLAEKGLLFKLFTQNIDCLERAAGVPGDLIVEAHGSFASQRCIECKTEYPDDLMMKAIEAGDIPLCVVPQCNGFVKPDIVFFGEALPVTFARERPKVAEAQLVIIMGTSLSVQPFASLPEFALEGVPRLLLNRERVGGLGSRTDDVCVLADCDDGVRQLSEALGWKDELEALWMARSGITAEDVKKGEAESKLTRDERLEAEIEKLTGEVDRTLKLSNGHKEWLEAHLEKKEEEWISSADEKEGLGDAVVLEPESTNDDTPLKESGSSIKEESEKDVDGSPKPVVEHQVSIQSKDTTVPTPKESSLDFQQPQTPNSASNVPTPPPTDLDPNAIVIPDKEEPKKAPGAHI